ncbi:DUF6531 domain-containing protein [Marinovum sp.]|uniref:DUF6531 domain-containing protein n=1 Tax=Marinovum sp. TaxID=2024839 RepID=UPI003A92B3F5
MPLRIPLDRTALVRLIATAACCLALLLALPALAEVGSALRLSTDVRRGDAPLTVQFRPLARTYPAGKIARVEIDPGDGSGAIVLHTGRGWFRPRPRHSYGTPGTYSARLTMLTDDGQRLTTRTRITVLPATPADPSELLTATPVTGDAPHEVTFKIGGATLPFTARRGRLSFGDGQAIWVMPHETVTHSYARPGRYAARLDIRGDRGNRARALRVITVAEQARLRFTVAPASGVAPVEVTLRANVPRGDVQRAGVLQDGREILGTQAITGRAEGHLRLTLTEPGTYRFELRVITRNGRRHRELRTVTVRPANLADAGPTFYAHDGGVVQIVQQGGSFEAIMRAPTVDQARKGYDIHTVLARGAFANRAYSALRPLDPDNPDSPRRRFYESHPVQIAGGTYLIRDEDCPDQWGQYAFHINYDPAGKATAISGPVTFASYTTRSDRAHARLGLPPGSPGIVGNIAWVNHLISIMRAAGDYSDRPHECVASDAADDIRPAVFTRITEEEARAIARENIGATRDFAQIAYDTSDRSVPGDGTPRNRDAESGETAVSSDPVILASGEFIETATDLEGPAPLGLGWRFQRTYRSQSLNHTSLGHGWTHNYQLALTRDREGWRLRDENGAHALYVASGDGSFATADGSRLDIGETRRRITFPSGRVYDFQPVTEDPDRSYLEAIEDPTGARMSMDYDLLGRLVRVTDPAGRQARYSYDSNRGYLVGVTAPDGRAVHFDHDAQGNLTRVAQVSAVTGDTLAETRFGYAAVDEAAEAALRHNLTEIRLSPGSGGGWGVIRLQYGADPEALDFDRVIWQQTDTLVETFAYRRGADPEQETFATTLQAPGRATEEHVFAPDGRHLGTSYVLPDETLLETLFLYDAEGRRSGQQFADGSRIEILPGSDPDVSVLRETPAETQTGATDRLWLYQSEPRFGQLRAIYGPFSGTVPTLAEAAPALQMQRVFDYESDGGGSLGRIVSEERKGADGTTRRIEYSWNEDGSLAEMRLPGTARRTYAYDTSGALQEVTDHLQDGSAWTIARYDWDDAGRLIGAQQGDGVFTGFEWDADGRMVRSLGADGTERQFHHDGADRVIAEDLNGARRAEYAYDAFGRLKTRRLFRAEGEPVEEHYVHDAFGRLIAMEDPAGRWERDQDPLGRTIAERLPDRPERRFAYDVLGALVREEGEGWWLTHRHDRDGRRIETLFHDGTRTSFDHAAGLPVRQQSFSADGRLLEDLLIDPGDATLGVAQALGEAAIWSGPPGRAAPALTAYALSDLDIGVDGRLTRFKLQDGAEWQIRYTPTGQMASLARNGIEYFGASFDAADTPTSLHFYGFSPRQIARDGGEVVTIDGRGAILRDRQDVFGNLISRTAQLGEAVQTLDFERDALGRMIAHSRDGVRWQREFGDGSATRETLTLPDGARYHLTRRLDDRGRLVERVLPSGLALTFHYPDEDQVELSVNDDVLSLTYDGSGALTRAALGTAEITYAYPAAQARDGRFSVAVNGMVLQSLQIDTGRVRGIHDPISDEVRPFAHDTAGRLTAAFVPGPDWMSADRFAYDALGSPLGTSGETMLPGHGEMTHAAALDPDGRVLGMTERSFRRDAFGQVSGAETGGTESRYLRDAQGRVVSLTGAGLRHDILYDGGTIAEVHGGDQGPVTYIADANGLLIARHVGGTTELLALDYGGAPIAAVNGDGTITERTYLSPFGRILDGSFSALPPEMPRPLFHGMLFDPRQALYLTPYRAYLPELAQFLAPEPLGPLASVHPYLYAQGDPFTYRDATGAQSSGSMQTNTDGDAARGFVTAGQDALNAVPNKLKEELNGRMADADPGRRNRQAGGTPPGQGEKRRARQPGPDSYTVPPSPPETPEQRRQRREREALRQAALSDLQRNIAEQEARDRAANAAFKRNVGHARHVLPEGIAQRWLQADEVFARSFPRLWKDDEVPWGEHATGPVSGSPGDPHGLLRATLGGDHRVQGRRGDRLRYIFRNQLAVQAPVPTPREQARQPDRIPRPGGVSGHMSPPKPAGTAPEPPIAPPTPTPRQPRKPGGLLGGLF